MRTNETLNPNVEISLRQAAIVAGIASLLMAVAAVFAEFRAHQSLFIPGNAAQTIENLNTQAGVFRGGMAAFMLVLLCDVLVSWAFYLFFAPVHRSLSLLACCFRLVYTAAFGLSLLSLQSGFRLATNPALLSDAGQMGQQVMFHAQAFDDGWAIALVFFAAHLLLLSYLLFRSEGIPRVFGGLLLMAGLAYLTDNFAKFLMPDYATYKATFTLMVALPSIFGELGFAIWLLLRGGRR